MIHRVSNAVIVAAILLAAATAWAEGIEVPGFGPTEQARAEAISLSGPTALEVGQEGTFRLHGTPTVDLALPLVDQLDWALGPARMYCYALPPGQAKASVDVRLELVISDTGATLQPILRVTPDRPGPWRLVVDWNAGQTQLAEYLVEVRGPPEPDPEPDPEPEPDPDPEPDQKWQVMFFHESHELDNLPLAQRELLAGRVAREELESRGHSFLGAPDISTGDNAWFRAAKGHALPCVAVAPLHGGDIQVHPLPADKAALWTLLEGLR